MVLEPSGVTSYTNYTVAGPVRDAWERREYVWRQSPGTLVPWPDHTNSSLLRAYVVSHRPYEGTVAQFFTVMFYGTTGERYHDPVAQIEDSAAAVTVVVLSRHAWPKASGSDSAGLSSPPSTQETR